MKLVPSWGLTLQAVPVKPPSRKDILEGVKRTLSHFRVMATGSGCALVQLQPLTGGSGAPASLDGGRQEGRKKVVVVAAAWGTSAGP